MKIGFMGGTFDPIHNGHLILGIKALEELGLDEIWYIPTGFSYMKSDKKVSPSIVRKEMVELAIKNCKEFKVSDIEINREGYTYTYETVEQLHNQYPSYEFYFIFGADCLFSINSWKNPEKIFEFCQGVTAVRNDISRSEMLDKIKELNDTINAKIHLIKFDNIEISSSEIRDRVKNGKNIRFFVPERVADYILENNLYK